MRLAAADAKIFAVEIERLFGGPEPLDHADPFAAEGVALVVLALRRTEHLHLGRKPAHHQVQTEAAVRDMVNRYALLGRDDGMNGRHVRGREHHDALGRGSQPRRPGVGLEANAVEIGWCRQSRAIARSAQASRIPSRPRAARSRGCVPRSSGRSSPRARPSVRYCNWCRRARA